MADEMSPLEGIFALCLMFGLGFLGGAFKTIGGRPGRRQPFPDPATARSMGERALLAASAARFKTEARMFPFFWRWGRLLTAIGAPGLLLVRLLD